VDTPLFKKGLTALLALEGGGAWSNSHPCPYWSSANMLPPSVTVLSENWTRILLNGGVPCFGGASLPERKVILSTFAAQNSGSPGGP